MLVNDMNSVLGQHKYQNRYEINGLIARGGMAQVFRATDLALRRPVAIKVLHPELSVDSTFIERFRQEALAAANLSHPNIVRVFDWGQEDGNYFIVMELIEGTCLAGLLNDQPVLSPTKAASVCSQVAAALAHSHSSGVVHRDIKPGNILITEDGTVKVTDFGIAQATSTHDHLVAEGSVMGTASYFSPEQASGLVVDGRSDIYSLGVVLYEMLAGGPPFTGDSPATVASMHVRNELPSLREISPEVHVELEAIVLKALAKTPSLRYQSANQMQADLLRFLEGLPVQAATHGRRTSVINDATQAVDIVSGERTQAVAIQSGPRTDVVRRRKSNAVLVATTAALTTCLIALLGFFMLGSSATMVMPNVVGTSITEASSLITGQGLHIGATKLVESDQPAGTVVGSTPRAGEHVAKGQSITLRVSLGVSTQPLTIPNVTGMSISAAERELQTLGLSYEVTFLSSLPEGLDPATVLTQNPPSGTRGRSGDKVTISYLSPDAMLPVPTITKMTPTAATTVLRKLGMTLDSLQTQGCSNTVPEGLVISSTPNVGSMVQPGAIISVVVSSGYCNMVVPNVIGFSQSSAESAMKKQGFLVSVDTLSFDDVLCLNNPGEVIRQDVEAGAMVLFNSQITLTYCPSS